MARSARPVSTLRTSSVSVDTRDFRLFARALRKAAKANSLIMRRGMNTAGMLVAEEAKRNAKDIPGKVRTDRIADSVKVRIRGASVVIEAGGPTAPEAAPLEVGNKKSPGAKTFRHPVFGNRDRWVDQDTHPFLDPAMAHKGTVAAELALQSIDQAISTAVHDRR